ncbi:folate-sensitive fragile site protein Fra10Ac1-domain-containing protein [Jimgerdemannia flammicorona]|uniref:Folate-sensitive fragile site protein Fra10Ac1-domain-containing protein n=1 Tax=Jimgerdemannia flammicorona TaxID=994334 RepID=A0A433Q4B3_9FUNG|nr:folate-sensitive fragile site protein Fra10Ac1-domain-containing protein [Jimgerdemannia flammicorona]
MSEFNTVTQPYKPFATTALSSSHTTMAQTDHSKRIFRNEFNGSDAYTRHKKLINDYFLFYPPKPSERTVAGKTELDVLKENHEFIRNPDEDGSSVTWEQRVAKKYYDKLFKEYAICELKYYKENKVV